MALQQHPTQAKEESNQRAADWFFCQEGGSNYNIRTNRCEGRSLWDERNAELNESGENLYPHEVNDRVTIYVKLEKDEYDKDEDKWYHEARIQYYTIDEQRRYGIPLAISKELESKGEVALASVEHLFRNNSIDNIKTKFADEDRYDREQEDHGVGGDGSDAGRAAASISAE